MKFKWSLLIFIITFSIFTFSRPMSQIIKNDIILGLHAIKEDITVSDSDNLLSTSEFIKSSNEIENKIKLSLFKRLLFEKILRRQNWGGDQNEILNRLLELKAEFIQQKLNGESITIDRAKWQEIIELSSLFLKEQQKQQPFCKRFGFGAFNFVRSKIGFGMNIVANKFGAAISILSILGILNIYLTKTPIGFFEPFTVVPRMIGSFLMALSKKSYTNLFAKSIDLILKWSTGSQMKDWVTLFLLVWLLK